MRTSDYLQLIWRGIKMAFLRDKTPILGTIILTDKCNLECKHCATHDYAERTSTYKQTLSEMQRLYDLGVRILFFSGGETTLWRDENANKSLDDLLNDARKMGFLIINFVTNGTQRLDYPEADLILLSVDGDKETHNKIRGDCFDTILDTLDRDKPNNICLYPALNNMNSHTLDFLCEFAQNHPHIQGISFNFHTPYPGTEHLAFTHKEIDLLCKRILEHHNAGVKMFNLPMTFKKISKSKIKPCNQCVVIEDGKLSECARCKHIPGLCEKCGYLFVHEFNSIFRGNPKALWQMHKIFRQFV